MEVVYRSSMPAFTLKFDVKIQTQHTHTNINALTHTRTHRVSTGWCDCTTTASAAFLLTVCNTKFRQNQAARSGEGLSPKLPRACPKRTIDRWMSCLGILGLAGVLKFLGCVFTTSRTLFLSRAAALAPARCICALPCSLSAVVL